jgi:hypothetical protein
MNYPYHLNQTIVCFCFLLLTFSIGCNQHGKNRQDKNTPQNYFVRATDSDAVDESNVQIVHSIKSLQSIRFQAGDTIFFQGGQVFEGTIQLLLKGAPEDPIVLLSKGRGKAIIDGKNNEALKLQGHNFQVKNLQLIGAGRKNGNITNGFILDGAHDVWIDSIQISGFQKSGLAVLNSFNVLIRNVHAMGNGAIGISMDHSKNAVIQDCLAEDNPGDPTNLTNHSGNGILVGNSKNVLIDHCVATNNGWDMPRVGNGPVGIWTYQSDSIIIQYCISYKNKTSEGGKDGGGFDFDGGVSNSIMQYCLSYENEGAGYGLFQYSGADNWSNNIIRYCLSIDDGAKTEGAGGIFLWNGGASSSELTNAFIHNNVVVNQHKPCVVFEPASKNENVLLANNLFIGKQELVSGPTSGEKFIGNVYWRLDDQAISFRGFKSLKDWAESTKQEKWNGKLVGKVLNPRLKGPLTIKTTDPYQLDQLTAYQLQEPSPLKDSGINLEKIGVINLPPTDFYGNPITDRNSTEPGIYEIN